MGTPPKSRRATDPRAKASEDNGTYLATGGTVRRAMRVGEAPRGTVPATSDDGRDSRERPAPNLKLKELNREQQLDHRMALRRGLHFLRGFGVRSTQPITKMDQVGSRYRLAALRDDCGCGWSLPGCLSRFPAMTIRRVGRPYQFSRPYELSVSSSSHRSSFKPARASLLRHRRQSQRTEGIVGNVRKVVGEIRNV